MAGKGRDRNEERCWWLVVMSVPTTGAASSARNKRVTLEQARLFGRNHSGNRGLTVSFLFSLFFCVRVLV